MSDNDTLEHHYHQAVKLWKQFCVEHTALLDATFDEYSLLLSSDVDLLEKKIVEKNKILEKIALLEQERGKLVNSVSRITDKKVGDIVDFIQILKQYDEKGPDAGHLDKLNKLLIDIIGKIKEQNKKNHLFINKALASLNEMRNSMVGEKIYSTYNSKGERA